MDCMIFENWNSIRKYFGMILYTKERKNKAERRREGNSQDK